MCASSEAYAALAVSDRNKPDLKQYFVVTAEDRFGPYRQVIDLQFSFDASRVLYGAETGEGWFVHDGPQRYGPYTRPQTLKSGSAGLECLYLAETADLEQCLYANGRVKGGGIAVPCTSYVVSEDGKTAAWVTFSLASSFINWRDNLYGPFDSVEKLVIAPDGDTIAYLVKESFLGRPGDGATPTPFEGVVQEIIFGRSVEKKLGRYAAVGGLVLSGFGSDYCFAAQLQPQETWSIVRHTGTAGTGLYDIPLLRVMPNGVDLVYTARPAEDPGSGGTMVYHQGSAIGGPYQEIRDLAVSDSGQSLAVIASTADGWYLILAGGGVGPFADLRSAVFFGDSAVTFEALYEGEWMSLMTAGEGLQIGACIIKENKTAGLAHYNGSVIDLYGW